MTTSLFFPKSGLIIEIPFQFIFFTIPVVYCSWVLLSRVYPVVFRLIRSRQVFIDVARHFNLPLSADIRSSPRKFFQNQIQLQGNVKIQLKGGSKDQKICIENLVFNANNCIRIVIPVSRSLEENRFIIKREALLGKIGKAVGFQYLKSGDPSFDREFRIEGNDSELNNAYIVGVMNGHAREIIRTIFSFQGKSWDIQSIEVNSTSILFHSFIKYSDTSLARYITRTAELLFQLKRQILWGERISDSLMENALHDSSPAVRKENLSVLLASFPLDDSICKRIRLLLKDPAPQVSMEAAKVLEEEGIEHLCSIMLNGKSPWRQKSAEILRTSHHYKVLEAIRKIFAGPKAGLDKGFLCSIIQILAELNPPDTINLLLENFLRVPYKEVKMEVARALTTVSADVGADGQRLNDFLLHYLNDEDKNLHWLTVSALAKYGNLSAVAPLDELSQEMVFNLPLKSEIQKSIAQIQERCGKGEAGWLSITANNSPSGKLSFPKPTLPKGGLSVTPDRKNLECTSKLEEPLKSDLQQSDDQGQNEED